MKKIFRMALVFALAGAALLYTSCTKDYSPDILEVQKKVNSLEGQLHDALVTLSEVQGKISNLESTDADLQKQITATNKAIEDAQKALQDAIKKGDDGVTAYVNNEIKKVKESMELLAEALSGALEEIVEQHDLDIADLQDQLDDLADAHDLDIADLKDQLGDLKDQLDELSDTHDLDVADLQGQIDDLLDQIGDLSDAHDLDVADLQGQLDDLLVKLGDLADAHDLDIAGLQGQIDNLADDMDEALEAINDTLEELYGLELPAIWDAIEALQDGSKDLDQLFATYAKFIQSIAYVPATSDGAVVATPFNFTNDKTSAPVLVASFKVTPTEALARVTETSATLVAVETKAAAAAPDTLTITKMVFRDDAPGYVDVYASCDVDYDTFAIALAVTQEENTLTESVTSDYAPVAVAAAAADLKFEIFDGDVDELLEVDPYEEEPVRVSPSDETDSVRVLTEGRWIVKAAVEGEYFTPEELQEILQAPELSDVSPLVADTLSYCFDYDNLYSNNDAGFNITIWPTRPKTIIDILTDDNDANNKYFAQIYLGNSHMETPVPSQGLVQGTYFAVPDTVAFDMVPSEDVAIAWDYKYWDNIADTTIAKVAVPDGFAEKIADADTTLNVNTESDVNYTELQRKAEVKKVDDTHVDAQILSSAPYGDADSTYTFSAEKFFKGNATEYVGSFDYVVKARPADLVLEYELADTCIRFEKKTWFNNLPFVADILDNQPEYLLDGKYEAEDVIDDIASTLKPQFDSLVVYLDGEKISWSGYGFSIAADGCDFGFKLDKLGAYEFHLFDHAFGIKYEFVLKVNVVNNAAKIAPKATFVTIDNAETKDYSVQVKGDYDENFHYYLVDQVFQDYLKVVDYAEDSDVLKLNTALATPEAEDLVWEPFETNNPTALDRLTEDATTANLHNKLVYKWDKYDSLQFKVAATLIPAANTDYVIDSATVRLWTVDPIPVFNGGNGIIALHEKDQYAVADVMSALTVQDLNGYDLVGKVGDNYQLLTPDGVTVFGYNQDITFGKPVLVSGVDYIEEVRLQMIDNILRLELNQGTIVTPIVVKVPVTLTYMLDQGLEDKNTVYVYVTFKEK